MVLRTTCRIQSVDMGRSGRDDARSEGAFPGERDLRAPSDAVVVAGGGVTPMGVELVVGGSISSRFVLSDGLCARGKRFKIG